MSTSESSLEPSNSNNGKGINRIAIQGYFGAFHEIAARFFFDKDLEIVPAETFEDLITMIEEQDAVDIGLMAIENTLAGSILPNYKLINQSKLKIAGEVFLRIKQNLMVLPGVKIEDLVEVHSHPVALVQCRQFFKQYPHIKLVATTDTALSAKNIKDNDLRNVGAIASTLAAEMYGMEIIGASIETNKENYTRFLILDQEDKITTSADADKVSLCFSVSHEVGSLHRVLAVLAAYNVNLTKIQSVPIVGKQWEYLFFIDFKKDAKMGINQAIDAISPLTIDLNILGVYKTGNHYEY